jgi:AcrR family transcriptional regulator
MDPRIARTRTSLQQALLDLARERPLEEITIADLVEHAGVNRSSFYQHYSDKETLLADALDAATEEVGATLELPPGEVPTEPPAALRHYLVHVDANAALYRGVLGTRGSAIVAERMRSKIEDIVRAAMSSSADLHAYEGLPLDVLAAGITGMALGVLRAWLERDPRPSVDEAVDWLWRALLGPTGQPT